MLKTMLKYTLKTLFRRKKALIGAVITISLCIALSLAVFYTFFSIKSSYEDYFLENYGEYTGLLAVNSQELFNFAEKSDSVTGFVYNLGAVCSPKSMYDSRLSVGYVSNANQDNSHIKITEGRLPCNNNEIAVERSLGEKLLLDLSVGSTIELELFLKSGEKETFLLTVVGTINDYSALSEMQQDSVMVLPSVLVSESFANGIQNKEIYAFVSNITSNMLLDTANEYNTNYYVNPIHNKASAMYAISQSTSVIFTILAVCALLIVFVSIYAYVKISEPEMAEHYKNLKIMGAGNVELIVFFFLRSFVIYCMSVIFGTLLGILSSYLFGRFIAVKFINIYDFSFSPIPLLLGIVLPLVFILIPLGIRLIFVLNKKPFQTDSALIYYENRNLNIRNILSKWFAVSFLNSKKTYIGLAFTMSFCFFTVFIGAMFNYTIRDEYEKDFFDDYSINAYDGNFATSFELPLLPYYGVTDGLIEELKSIDNVSQVSTIKELTVIVEDTSKNTALKNFFGKSIREFSISMNDFDYITSAFGLNYDSEYYKTSLAEIDDHLLTELISYDNILGNPTIDNLKSGNEIIIVCFDTDYCPYKPGDTVNLFQALSNDSSYFSVENCDILNIAVKVNSVVEINDRHSYLGEKLFAGSGMKCIFGEGSFEKNGFMLNNRNVYVNLDNKYHHDDVDEILVKIKTALPNSKITSKIETETEKQALLNSINLSVWCLVAFVWIICMFVYINIINSKYHSQKRLWGVLRAMGVKRRNVIVNHICETFIVCLTAVAFNLLFIALVKLLPVRNDIPLFTPQLLIAYLISIIISCVGTLPSVLKIFKPNIIEQIEYID